MKSKEFEVGRIYEGTILGHRSQRCIFAQLPDDTYVFVDLGTGLAGKPHTLEQVQRDCAFAHLLNVKITLSGV